MKNLAFLLLLLVCLGCQDDSTATTSPGPDSEVRSKEEPANLPEEAEEHPTGDISGPPMQDRRWEKIEIDSLAGRPISFYLNHPEVDSLAVRFYEDPWIPMDDDSTFELIELTSTLSGELAPFYLWMLDRIVKRSDGALAEGIAGNCSRVFRQQAGSLFYVFGSWEPSRKDWDEDRVRAWVGLIAFGSYYEENHVAQLIRQVWQNVTSEKEEVQNLVKGLSLSILKAASSYPEPGYEIQPENLADYLNLLPAAREIIGDWPYPVHEFDGQGYTLSEVDGSLMEVIYDPKNGYFMASDTEGEGEIERAVALFRKADGTAIIGVEVCYGCSAGHANASELHFLEWIGDRWREMNAKVLPPSLMEAIEMDLRTDLPASCEGVPLQLMIRLPQKGTLVPVRLVAKGAGDCADYLAQKPSVQMTWDKRIGTLMW